VLRRDDFEHERTVRASPAGMDAVDLAIVLRLALDDARLQAEQLNGPG
jgi:hypothetical protein